MADLEVLGRRMHVRDTGAGPPVVFLHGNPTSSLLWREVTPLLEDAYRCVAPDLIGMGASEKLPGTGDSRYRFFAHRRFLDALLDALDLDGGIVLVGHDWGGVLAVDRARRDTRGVRGIAYLEAGVVPVSWVAGTGPDEDLFGALRSPAGEQLVLEENVFVERVLQAGTVRTMRVDELAAYRAPFERPGEGRRAMLTWARQIPIDGQPADVHEIVALGAEWMASNPLPKLLVRGDPGAVISGAVLAECRRWPAQTEVGVPGTHFLPHDSPTAIGTALRTWLDTLPEPGRA